MLSQNSIEENSIEENSIDIYTPSETEVSAGDVAKASKHKYGKYKHVLLKDQELQTLQKDFDNWEELIDYLDEYIEMKGYKAKSHYLCIRKWVVDAVKKEHLKHERQTGGCEKQKDKWDRFVANYKDGGSSDD